MGQAMDLHSSRVANEKLNFSNFNMEKYKAIVKYKTAYYSFFLPVALAMRLVSMWTWFPLLTEPDFDLLYWHKGWH